MVRKLTALAALAIVALGGFYFMQSNPQTNPVGIALAQSPEDVDTSMIQEMSLGNPDADVTIIEYASFTCPHCAAFHAENFKKLKAEYIDTGKVHFIYREVYFDRFGLWAGIVARCGENAESRYFGIADMIYQQQSDWARQSDPAAIVERLRTIGKTAGLTDDQLDQCFTDGEKAQAMYALWLQNAEADGINSTPSFIIDGKLSKNVPYDEMKALIDAALEG